ncbi:MAG: hypothetical protein CFH06_01281 [Alphaproteobacteria bacterium MarineAlpha3_Bin5]|nr:xanthine dehydrogenase accessory protein XdhC [Magnetovibrio sp.]PPR77433.1 MAG: hypothetical protein CFH06_01281 [Alphaproteobacteria bacterium MarineAlpha3_Bin5]
MTANWLGQVSQLVDLHGSLVRISIISTKGSVPQKVGAAMIVTKDVFCGTIGGGALEKEAQERGLEMLSDESGKGSALWARYIRDYPLGPSLGQCCGGYVKLLFEKITSLEYAAIDHSLITDFKETDAFALHPLGSGAPTKLTKLDDQNKDAWPPQLQTAMIKMKEGNSCEPVLTKEWFIEPLQQTVYPLFLYGAGHVGKAVVKIFSTLPFEVHWVDIDASRFPQKVPQGVRKTVAHQPPVISQHAPENAFHVVMTFSHALDFDICRTVLERGVFTYLGVIASKTKRVRFKRQLIKAGISEKLVERLHAPIGLEKLSGKEPHCIAISLAADLLIRLQDLPAPGFIATKNPERPNT